MVGPPGWWHAPRSSLGGPIYAVHVELDGIPGTVAAVVGVILEASCLLQLRLSPLPPGGAFGIEGALQLAGELPKLERSLPEPVLLRRAVLALSDRGRTR